MIFIYFVLDGSIFIIYNKNITNKNIFWRCYEKNLFSVVAAGIAAAVMSVSVSAVGMESVPDTIISTVSGGYISNSSQYNNSWCEQGSNCGYTFAPFCYKYAFARYYLTFKNKYGTEKTYSVYVDCNVKGSSTSA